MDQHTDSTGRTESTGAAAPAALLQVNSIEVIYNHIILVLKGVSLTLPQGAIVALLGGCLLYTSPSPRD